MDKTELENLIVRLTGDGSGLTATFGKAQSDAKTASVSIQKSLDDINKKLKGFGETATGALQSIGIGASIKGLLDNYMSMEKNTIRLSAAIEVNGGNVQELIPQYRELAATIAETTLTTRGEVMAMAQKAEMYGLTGGNAERAIRNSIALASATGREASELLMVTAAMERGNYQMLRRIPGLRGIHDQSQLVARAQQMMTAGMKAAEAESNSLTGQIHHLWEEMKLLSKPLGEDFAGMLKPLVSGVREAVKWFNELDPSIRRSMVIAVGIVAAIAAIGPAIAAITPFIGTITTGFSIVAGIIGAIFSPLGLILVPLGLLAIRTYEWVKSVGGAGAAWEIVKKKAAEFWDWLDPIMKAARDLSIVVWGVIKEAAIFTWEVIKQAAADLWEFVEAMWVSLGGSTNLTWDDIRKAITRSILFIEFSIKNFRMVWELAVTSAALQLSRWSDRFKLVFATALAIAQTWAYAFVKLVQYATSPSQWNQRGWDALIRETREVAGEYSREWLRAFGITRNGVSDTTRLLERELNQQAAAVGGAFATFVAERERQWANERRAPVSPIPRRNQQIANSYSAATKEIQKFDAALVGSAESMSRLFSHDLFLRHVIGGGQGSPNIGGEARSQVPFFAPPAPGAPGLPGQPGGGGAPGLPGNVPPAPPLPGAPAAPGNVFNIAPIIAQLTTANAHLARLPGQVSPLPLPVRVENLPAGAAPVAANNNNNNAAIETWLEFISEQIAFLASADQITTLTGSVDSLMTAEQGGEVIRGLGDIERALAGANIG